MLGLLASLLLFSDGSTDWKIVAAEGTADDTPIVYAVRELRTALKKVSGADFAAETGVSGSRRIFVGLDAALSKDGREHVAVRMSGDAIDLVGNEPRAVLHAVYLFLQRELGVRWLWPGADGEFVPRRSTWEVPERSYEHVPSVKYRGFHMCGDWYGRDEFMVWMARNFMSAHRQGVRRAEERRLGFYDFLCAHNVSLNRRPDVWERHPEYYAELDGVRTKVNICLSSEGCLETVAEQLAETIRKRPGLEIVSVFPPDNQDYCRCAKCRTMSVSTAWFTFYNKLVAKLRGAFPDLKFATIAYQGYRDVPVGVKPDAEFVEYATMERCYIHGLDDPTCPLNRAECAHLDDWEKTGLPVGEYAYDYDAFITRSVLMPFLSQIERTVNAAVRRGHVSLIPEVMMSPRTGPDEKVASCQNRLSELFYARKMWDASLSKEAFLDDWCRTAFGTAAEPMKDYFLAFDRAWQSVPNHHLRLLQDAMNTVPKVLSEEVRKELEKSLASAETTAGLSERQRAAIAWERALFMQWTEMADFAQGRTSGSNLRPIFYWTENPTIAAQPAKVRADLAACGWDAAFATNAVQAAGAVSPDAKVYWFRNVSGKKLPPHVKATVEKAVREDGAIALFGGYNALDVDAVFGKPYAVKTVRMFMGAYSHRRPTYIRPGDWSTKPHDILRFLRGITPAYGQEPVSPEGWTVYLKGKTKDGAREAPFLVSKPYGRGLVVVAGESVSMNFGGFFQNVMLEKGREE